MSKKCKHCGEDYNNCWCEPDYRGCDDDWNYNFEKDEEEEEEYNENKNVDKGGFLGTGFNYVAGDPFW